MKDSPRTFSTISIGCRRPVPAGASAPGSSSWPCSRSLPAVDGMCCGGTSWASRSLRLPRIWRHCEHSRGFARSLSEENQLEFIVAVSQVVREYIQARFGVRAPHRSSKEFLEEAHASEPLLRDHRESLGGFLSQCDLVKFAQRRVVLVQMGELLECARRFVESTIPAEPAKTPPADGTSAHIPVQPAVVVAPSGAGSFADLAARAAGHHERAGLFLGGAASQCGGVVRRNPGKWLGVTGDAAMVLMILALAGPRIEQGSSNDKKEGIVIVFAVDALRLDGGRAWIT